METIGQFRAGQLTEGYRIKREAVGEIMDLEKEIERHIEDEKVDNDFADQLRHELESERLVDIPDRTSL